jgi:hypothetical protein
MAAGASSGSRFKADGIVNGKARRRTEPNRKIGKERVEWIGENGVGTRCGQSAGSNASLDGSRRRRNRKDGGRRRGARNPFQRVSSQSRRQRDHRQRGEQHGQKDKVGERLPNVGQREDDRSE